MTHHDKRNKEALKDILNQMFILSGHKCTYEEIENRTDRWYTEMTMTESESKLWYDWGVDYLTKKFKSNKKFAERQMSLIGMQFGLRVDVKKEERENKISEILK